MASGKYNVGVRLVRWEGGKGERVINEVIRSERLESGEV